MSLSQRLYSHGRFGSRLYVAIADVCLRSPVSGSGWKAATRNYDGRNATGNPDIAEGP